MLQELTFHNRYNAEAYGWSSSSGLCLIICIMSTVCLFLVTWLVIRAGKVFVRSFSLVSQPNQHFASLIGISSAYPVVFYKQVTISVGNWSWWVYMEKSGNWRWCCTWINVTPKLQHVGDRIVGDWNASSAGYNCHALLFLDLST